MNNPPETDPLQVLVDRIVACRRRVREMLAQRWLAAWPKGHPERPRTAPDYVQEFEKGA